MNFRILLLRVAALSLLFALPLAAQVAAEDTAAKPAVASAASNPAAMLGSAVPPSRIQFLGSTLRAALVPGGAVVTDVPFYEALRDTGTPGNPKYEVGGIAFDLVLSGYDVLRIANARVALMPSADGRKCRFELMGSPFGTTTKLEATGTVEWAAGPAGGDRLDLEFRLDDAPVAAVSTWLPNRIDPSFSGMLGLHGKASGVVGEVSNEDAPATPLRGDVDATLDWTALGRTGPFTIQSQFSLDDRMVRLKDGKLAWQGETADLKGWFQPRPQGEYELIAGFTNVDTKQVATRWNVPEPWRPASTLTGAITMKGTPGKGLIRYEAKAPVIEVPALAGYDVRVENARLIGSLVAINAEVAVSVRGDRIVVGGIDLGQLPVGVRWWKQELHVNNSNSNLWGGENDGSLEYTPANHPAVAFNGRLKNAQAAELVRNVAPWSGLDLEGSASIAFLVGQTKERTPQNSFHASLTQGRLGGVDLFARVLAALAEADPVLSLPDTATLVPPPRSGKGTRVDRCFFEADKKGEVFELGGFFLRAGGFQLDADGEYSRTGGVKLDGTVSLPPPIATRLIAAAPWLAALRHSEAQMFVPVTVSGPLASLTLALAPGYAELLAKAKRGEAVTAPGLKIARHVGVEGLATIPVDPAIENQQ